MSHNNIIVDTDAHFKIDPITRCMTCSAGKSTLVQYDHNSERFTFDIPKTVEGHDISRVTKIEIHYINISENKLSRNTGLYEVEDIAADENGNVTFSWLISNNATQWVGVLSFAVRIVCADSNGDVFYSWGTKPYTAISISEGVYNSDVIVEKYADVLTEWEARITHLFETIGYITIPSVKGYVPVSTSDDGKVITLTSVAGLSIGDMMCMYINDAHAPYWQSKGIQAIDETTNTITLASGYTFEKLPLTGESTLKEGILICNDGTIGVIDVVIDEDTSMIEARDFGYGNKVGLHSNVFGDRNTASGIGSFVVGDRNVASGVSSFVIGSKNTVTGKDSTAEGYGNKNYAGVSHVEGITNTILVGGDYGHLEGQGHTLSGKYAHGEGQSNTVHAEAGHVEGATNQMESTAYFGHLEGHGNVMTGHTSHGEGKENQIYGQISHVEGWGNIAAGEIQHVQGKFCQPDESKAHIIGGGTTEYKKNIHTVDWSGNAFYAGTVECAGIILTSPNGTKYKITIDDNGNLVTKKS